MRAPPGHRLSIAAVCLVVSVLAVAPACRPASKATPGLLTILYPGGDRVLGLPEDDSPKQLVFLPLVTVGADGELTGRLLRSAERVPGTTTWIYHLRPDVRWHDGVPTTAHDVVWTIEFLRDTLVNWLRPGAYSIEALDDTTVRATYQESRAGEALLHLDTWQVFFPKHLLQDLDRRQMGDWAFWKQPIGNGPFRYVRSQPGERIELEANPDFYDGRPAIDRLVLRLGEPALAPMLSGEVDLMWVGPSLRQMFQHLRPGLVDNGPFVVRTEVGDMRVGAMYNHRDSLFGNPAVRRALTLAVDRQSTFRLQDPDLKVPVTDGVFVGHRPRLGDLAPALPYDPAWAGALLDSLGWQDRDGDGTRDRHGRPFRFTATTYSEGAAAAVVMQEALRQIGADMQIETLDANLIAPRLGRGEYSVIVGRIRNTFVGRFGLRALFGPQSVLGYRNDQVLAVLDRLRMAFEPDEIAAGYRELGLLLAADVPVTYLAPIASGMVASARVQGFDGLGPEGFAAVDRLRLADRTP